MENVEVFTSEGKGRGLKATKEFWAADVIFAERAYSAVVFDRYGKQEASSLEFWLPKSSGKGMKFVGCLIFNLKIIVCVCVCVKYA